MRRSSYGELGEQINVSLFSPSVILQMPEAENSLRSITSRVPSSYYYTDWAHRRPGLQSLTSILGDGDRADHAVWAIDIPG
jgi:hypothetical protein